MPILIALRALVGSWVGRIGGWLVAGLSVLAFLKWRDHAAKSEGRAEADAATREANLRTREEMAAVPKPDDAAVDEALRRGRF